MSHSTPTKAAQTGGKSGKMTASERAQAEFVKKQTEAAIKNHLPGGKVTKRSKVSKLETLEHTYLKLGDVAMKVFNIDPPPPSEATDSTKWEVTDEILYAEAKASYDTLLEPFQKSPRVYKFSSVKERIWNDLRKEKILREEEDRKNREEDAKEKDKILAKNRRLDAKNLEETKRKAELEELKKKDLWEKHKIYEAKRKEIQSQNQEETKPVASVVDTDDTQSPPDETVTTFLDPFALVPDWVEDIDEYTGKKTYLNLATRERRPIDDPPGRDQSIWLNKFEKLKRLVLKHDYSGYHYNEDDIERRKRLRMQVVYEKKMKEEIQRRETRPTQLEQIEDVLYEIVDKIAMEEELAQKAAAKAAKKELLRTWSVVAKGYNMHALEQIENEAGEIVIPVTDLDVTDMIVSDTGHVLATMMPPGLMESHQKERDELLRLEQEKLILEELERTRPILESLRIILAISRLNPKKATKKALKLFRTKAMNNFRRLQHFDHKAMVDNSKRSLIQGVTGLLRATLEAASDPMHTSAVLVRSVKSVLFTKSDQELELERLMKQYEEEDKKAREHELMLAGEQIAVVEEVKEEAPPPLYARPTKHVDTVVVTMTFLLNPPPHFVIRPPPTMTTKLQEKFDVLDTVKESLKTKNYLPLLPDLVATQVLGATDEEIDLAKKRLKKHMYDKRRALPPISRERDEEEDEDEEFEMPSLNNLNSKTLIHTGKMVLKSARRRANSLDIEPLRRQGLELMKEAGVKLAMRARDIGPLIKSKMEDLAIDLRQKFEDQLERIKQDIKSSEVTIPGYGTKQIGEVMEELQDFREKLPDKVEIKGVGTIPLTLKVPDLGLKKQAQAKFKSVRAKVVGKFEKMVALDKLDPALLNDDKDDAPPPTPRDIFDNSARKEWEMQLCREIANAVCLPVRNVSIEELRRLERDDPKLVELKRQHLERLAEQQRLRELRAEEAAQERERRKAYADFLESIRKQGEDDVIEEMFGIETAKLKETFKRTILSNTLGSTSFGKTGIVNEVDDNISMISGMDNSVKDPSKHPQPDPSIPDFQFPTSDYDELNNTSHTLMNGDDAYGLDPMMQTNGIGHKTNDINLEEVSLVLSAIVLAIETAEIAKNDNQVDAKFDSASISHMEVDGVLSNMIEAIETAASLRKEETTDSSNHTSGLQVEPQGLNSGDESGLSHDHTQNIQVAYNLRAQHYSQYQHQHHYRYHIQMKSKRELLAKLSHLRPFLLSNTRQQQHGRSARPLNVTHASQSMTDNLLANDPHNNEGRIATQPIEIKDDKKNVDLEGGGMVAETPMQENEDDKGDDGSSSFPRSDTREGTMPDSVYTHLVVREPRMPERFKIGIRNPEENKRDPRYWLAKEFKELDEEGKRRQRVRRLRNLQREDDLKSQLKGLRAQFKYLSAMKEQFLTDASYQYEMLTDALVPVKKLIAEKMAPYANKAKEVYDVWRGKLQLVLDERAEVIRRKELREIRLLAFDVEMMVLVEEMCDKVEENFKKWLPIYEQQLTTYEADVIWAVEHLCDDVVCLDIKEKREAKWAQEQEELRILEEARQARAKANNLPAGMSYKPPQFSDDDDSESEEEEGGKQRGGVGAKGKVAAVAAVDDDEEDDERDAKGNTTKNQAQAQAQAQAEREEELKNVNEQLAAIESQEANVNNMIALLASEEEKNRLAAEEAARWEAYYAEKREERLLSYDAEIVDLLHNMCMSIELAINAAAAEATSDLDKALAKFDKYNVWDDNDNPDDHRLTGCEVSFMIFINEDVTKIQGLENLQAEDVAVMLLEQIHDSESQLMSTPLTRRAVAGKYKVAFKKKLFTAWESFWVHSLHPVFFGHSTAKHKRKTIVSDGRTSTGVQIVNPLDTLPSNAKDQLVFLNSQKKAAPKKEEKKFDSRGRPRKVAVAAPVEEKKLIDFESFAQWGGKNMEGEIYRPNMGEVTATDVELCRLIYQKAQDFYDRNMKTGLVDGQRMRPDQYEAMKVRDTTFRIYRTAKQKYNQEHGGLDEVELPRLHVTRVDDEVFNSWIEEIKEEERQELKAYRLEVAKQKEVRQQEGLLRRQFDKQRIWFIERLVSQAKDSSEISLLMHKALQSEVEEKEKLNSTELSENVIATIREKIMEKQSKRIHEEKTTRRLHDIIIAWAWRVGVRKQRMAKMRRRIARSGVGFIDDEEARRRCAIMYRPEGKIDKNTKELMLKNLQNMDSNRRKNGLLGNVINTELLLTQVKEARGVEIDDVSMIAFNVSDTDDSRPTTRGVDDGEDSEDEEDMFQKRRKNHFAVNLEGFDIQGFLASLSDQDSDSDNEKAKRNDDDSDDEEDAIEVKETLPEGYEIGLLRSHLLAFLEMAKIGLANERYLKLDAERTKRINAQKRAFEQRMTSLKLAKEENRTKNETKKVNRRAGLVAIGSSISEKDKEKEKDEENKSEFEFNEEIEAEIPLPPRMPWEETLLTEELDIVKELRWIDLYSLCPELLACFQEFPLMEGSLVHRDELIQLAVLTLELQPVFKQVVQNLEDEKMAKIVAKGLKKAVKSTDNNNGDGLDGRAAIPSKNKNKGKGRQNTGFMGQKVEKEALTKEMEEAIAAAKLAKERANEMGMEAARRAERYVEALKRKAARERAWITAHPHKFVKIGSEAPFCVTCREREHEAWLNDHTKAEEEWKKYFEEDYLLDTLEALSEPTLQRLAKEREYMARLRINQAKGAKIDPILIELMNEMIEETELREYGEVIEPDDDYEGINTTVPVNAYYACEVEELPPLLHAEYLARAPYKPSDAFIQSGLSPFDAEGVCILPKPTEEEERKLEESALKQKQMTMNDVPRDGSDPNPPLGVKIRLWDKDIENEEKGDFLGTVVLDYKTMMDPPKGMRSYPLIDEPLCTKYGSSGKFVIKGNLTLKIFIRKKDEDNVPIEWKLEIMRASKLAAVDPKKLSSPFCEILWRGPADKGEYEITLWNWVSIGETKAKPKTVDPIWTRADMTEFQIPPIWTDIPIPGRGRKGGYLKGGGWVAQNHIPPPLEKPKNVRSDFNSRMMWKKVMWTVRVVVRMTGGSKNAINQEVTRYLEMKRALMLSEERERKCFAREERLMMRYLIDVELVRTKPYLIEQIEFARIFSRLLQLIEGCPKILSRLRFMMGSPDVEGGCRIMCQDPANYKFLDVIAIPMLYPEDEEEYSVQLSALIGKQHRNLVRVVDFSIHLARNFSFTGFASTSERMAITILERYDGPNMLEYMKERWHHMDNTDFRMLLSQVINGLIGLHEEGILHRNLSPTCIVVELPAGMRRVKGGMAGAKSENVVEKEEKVDDKGGGAANLIATYKKTSARLGEYWFLFNPRKAGCEYSQGRSDWGNRITVPPECSTGQPVTEKGDVYAFGVCVYIWATAAVGKSFPDMQVTRIDQLKEMIPIKWGSWVYTLLRMCLEKDPKKRAGSKEILSFLSSRTIEKLK